MRSSLFGIVRMVKARMSRLAFTSFHSSGVETVALLVVGGLLAGGVGMVF